MKNVTFTYFTGIAGDVLAGVQARLLGSWDAAGHYATDWLSLAMPAGQAADGCLCFGASVALDDAGQGQWFQWGVQFVYPDGHTTWAIPTEVQDPASHQQYRSFQLSQDGQQEAYYLTHSRWLGANKLHRADGTVGIRFAAWAPAAQQVEVVMGTIWNSNDPTYAPTAGALPRAELAGGYIAPDGTGTHPTWGPFAMTRDANGIWQTSPDDPALARFAAFDHQPYMYRITKHDGTVGYRTDLFSRCQLGYGSTNPALPQVKPFTGLLSDLSGLVSCSVVVDPEQVTAYFKEEPPYKLTPPNTVVWPEREFQPVADFWADEFTPGRPVPTRVEDLIIYELHLGALGFGQPGPGTLADAIALLDHLVDLGVNTVELLPMAEYEGGGGAWGYTTSHYFAIEYAGGGRDQYKYFVKACHQRGIAVLFDVVYNHFAPDGERAEWGYDASEPDLNCYYWYEGIPTDYPQPDGGYLDNDSTGYAPRYYEEMVRKLFISSAVALLTEFHVDGFRVDQTTAIHSYNCLHANGQSVANANAFGAKFLREFTTTLRLLRPEVLLIAEDHSDTAWVTWPLAAGGLGFDARWYANFYHHLIGDSQPGNPAYAQLLLRAGQGSNAALPVDFFAGALQASGAGCVVYNESHDEAGNSSGPFLDEGWNQSDVGKQYTSQRTIMVAANQAPLVDDTRRYAEARCRVAYALTVCSAGTPMFLFGEEVGAQLRFKYNAVLDNREDLTALRQGSGANLFGFYAASNHLRLALPALRSRTIDVFYVHNDNRVVAFRRWDDADELLVVASLNNQPFEQGYVIQTTPDRLPSGNWQEIFNTDAAAYGGNNVGNYGAEQYVSEGRLQLVIPANGLVILRKK